MAELEEQNKKNFSVRTVAELLQTNQETVRRWIRDGKLQAEISSKKKGYTITAEQLAEFLKSNSSGSLACMAFSPGSLLSAYYAAAGIAMKATSAVAEIIHKGNKISGDVKISNESLSGFLEQQIRITLEKIGSMDSQMTTVKAKIEAYQLVKQKNDALAQTNPSGSQESMSRYLNQQMEGLLQQYSSMEREMRIAEEQLRVYQDSMQTLEGIE